MRFNRDYILNANGVVIKPPLRIAFDCQKSVAGGLNSLNVKIYNLTEQHRLRLAKDQEEIKVMLITLAVGYAGEIEIIFKGTVERGINSRSGADHITTLKCLDGGFDFVNSFTSKTVVGKDNAVKEILKDMPNTGTGTITTQTALVRPKVLVGNSAKLIEQQLQDDEQWFIDDEKMNIIKETEFVSSFVPVVSSETGLTTTPSRENQKITFSSLMNPAIKIGGQAKLISKTAPHMDGIYRIESVGYTGDNFGSDWSQTVTGFKA